MRGSEIIGALGLVVAIAATGAGAETARAPSRVVSVNLCTDQLAMLLAAPGQLLAVSFIARDPLSSTMAAEAMAYPITYGGAEEVFLHDPDLVLAGTYTTKATVDLLRRLGVRVETFPPPSSLADVAAQMRAVGTVLGRAEAGEAMAAEFEAGLASLAEMPGARPRAALYYANGYTGGSGTLSGEILEAGGFRNLAAEAGMEAGGRLPLEVLIMLRPDTVIPGRSYPGTSRAEEVLRHPALTALRLSAATTDADWICGTPQVLRAVLAMRQARDEVVGR